MFIIGTFRTFVVVIVQFVILERGFQDGYFPSCYFPECGFPECGFRVAVVRVWISQAVQAGQFVGQAEHNNRLE